DCRTVAVDGARRSLLDHPTRDRLRQKVRRFEISVDNSIEALRSRIKQIDSPLRRNPRIVNQQVETTESLARLLNQTFALTRIGDIRATSFHTDLRVRTCSHNRRSRFISGGLVRRV